MAVLKPLKVVIDNYPEGQVEWLDATINPEKPELGSRKVPFSKVVYIEREDFQESPPKNFHRLSPGKEVRLQHAYYIKCVDVIKDEETGEIVEIHCTYDPETKGGWSTDGRKVKGTSHWVSASHALKAEVRLYDNLFIKEDPEDVEEGQSFLDNLAPNSLTVLRNCLVEPILKNAKPGERFQFLRQGYFCLDKDSDEDNLIFNRIVGLKDTWAKIQKAKLQDK
jgi:glutaminyl-tRNA synthetase